MRHLSLCFVLISALVAGGCTSTEAEDTRSSCARCHAPLDSTGIEDMHKPETGIACVDCHGGDPSEEEQDAAHVARPAGIDSVAQLRSLTSVELDAVDPSYIRWVNPSDYRIMDQTCGTSDCHPNIAATAASSIMTTFAGHWNKPRYSAGIQGDRAGEVAVRAQVDSNFEGLPGTVESLQVLSPPPLTADSPFGDFLDHYLAKGCPRCHVWNFGPNDTVGDFRSSGCAGCHANYRNDGLSLSGDPNINHDDPPHPEAHMMTSAIPDAQCEHCHYRGNRIGTMYRGVREAARIGDLPNIEVSTEQLHGRPPGFFVTDEDTTNDVDETPPDVHQSAGLGCVDCHVGQDVHGDGRIYTAHDYQVGIECEDCHGSVTERATPDAGGVFRTTAGDALKRLSLADDGSLVLRGALDNQDHPVTQLVDLDPSSNPNLAAAHGPDDGGANHTASMECYACHTAWTQSCLGCHVTVDTRYTGRNLIDGSVTAGRVGGTRSWVVTDYLALGVGVDGKLTPMAPQEKMFVTVVVPCDPAIETCDVPADGDLAGPGRKLWDQQVRHTQDGKLGMGFGPVAPHTTSRGSQACDRCHLREDGTNASIVDETLGRASGRFVIPDGDGVDYDLTQVVDAEGNAIVGMAHEGTAVLPADVVQRMLIPRVPNSGLTLREVPPWTPPD